jgi:hypothetical protein
VAGKKGRSGPPGNLNGVGQKTFPWRVFWRRRALAPRDRWIASTLRRRRDSRLRHIRPRYPTASRPASRRAGDQASRGPGVRARGTLASSFASGARSQVPSTRTMNPLRAASLRMSIAAPRAVWQSRLSASRQRSLPRDHLDRRVARQSTRRTPFRRTRPARGPDDGDSTPDRGLEHPGNRSGRHFEGDEAENSVGGARGPGCHASNGPLNAKSDDE